MGELAGGVERRGVWAGEPCGLQVSARVEEWGVKGVNVTHSFSGGGGGCYCADRDWGVSRGWAACYESQSFMLVCDAAHKIAQRSWERKR